jgi:hypothetical protein
VLPLRTVIGEPEECPRQLPGVARGAGGMAAYAPGRRLDDALLQTYRTSYPNAE